MAEWNEKKLGQMAQQLQELLEREDIVLSCGALGALEDAVALIEENLPRKAGEYTISQAIHIGDREVVFGENKTEENLPYLVAYAQIFPDVGIAQYSEAVAGDDYLEMVGLFLERVSAQVAEMERGQKELGIPIEPFTTKDVVEGSHLQDYTGKVMVVCAEVLRPEYRNMAHQLVYVMHGNGCRPHGHGRGVFTKTLATGLVQRFDRADFLGEIRPEVMPPWAKEKLAAMKKPKEKTENPREER